MDTNHESEPNWQPMDTAPRDATWVHVKLHDGKIHRAHYAEDLSGEEQPPFRGWFREFGNSFYEIPEPVAWAPEIGCAFCGGPTGRGQALCRKHWMALDHWHRVQIGNAMRDEKESGDGPDADGRYHSDEYLQAVRDAVTSLEHITQRRAD